MLLLVFYAFFENLLQERRECCENRIWFVFVHKHHTFLKFLLLLAEPAGRGKGHARPFSKNVGADSHR